MTQDMVGCLDNECFVYDRNIKELLKIHRIFFESAFLTVTAESMQVSMNTSQSRSSVYLARMKM